MTNCCFIQHIQKSFGNNEKVWIQRNQTDELIAEELVLMGVAREDIVLGLQPPYARQFTSYGVASAVRDRT